MTKIKTGLGIGGLAAIVISSMIGGGIFSLPQNMAQSASAGGVILAWAITGLGIWFIANTFRLLSALKPHLTSGIYMYSRQGFGPYMGFNIGWSYWLCQIFGNVGYAVITMDALDYFFPGTFTGGNNLASIIGGSLLIWFFNALVLQGVQNAAKINLIGTIAKIVPLVLFCFILIFCFRLKNFDFDFWGHLDFHRLGNLENQIKNSMLVTLWAFIGIEGAVVLSGRARSQNDVGRATVIGFLGCLVIYLFLSLLPFGLMTGDALSKIENPSTAGILEHVVGPWGSWLMNVGLIIAVLTSWLSWTMICAQIPQSMALDHTFPAVFGKENTQKAPVTSLWTTSFIMQLALFVVYFSNNAWNTMLSITGVMVLPAYLMSCLYLWKLAEDEPLTTKQSRFGIKINAILGAVYALWLIYAAGLKYLTLAVIFIAVGLPVYLSIQNRAKMRPYEKVIAAMIIIVALGAVYALVRGLIKV